MPARADAQYDADPAYYAGAVGKTGTALKSALTTAMSTGHVQSSYNEAADYLPFTDANPDDLTQMFEFYTHTIIQKPSASHRRFVGRYESREHVWPDSLQGPGDTTNSTRGSRGDIHMLKPLSQSVNGSRGNNFYGGATASGSARNLGGGVWFPGDSDKGDAARILFYAATRYGSTLSLINGTSGSDTQMGDLNALLHWHYQDVPDRFEQRRNDVIFRGDDANTVGDDITGWDGTKNRNAYIDRPEYAWSVFADQQNDTRLSVATPDTNGASSTTIDLGRVLRGAAVPSAQNVVLNKAGIDGTYYSVISSGDATSNVTGRYNAFAMDSAGSRAMSVGLNTSTSVAGLKSGRVTIDNLDVTTEGGAGRGANDANDTIDVRLAVLDASNSSFGHGVDTNDLSLSFGDASAARAPLERDFEVTNFGQGDATYIARLDLTSITAVGDTNAFAVDLALFQSLVAGDEREGAASFLAATPGVYAATYTLHFSDEQLPGVESTSELTLHLSGAIAVPEPGTLVAAMSGLLLLKRRRRA